MKLVILDHPDWLRLKQINKAAPVLNVGKCALALHKHPATKHWRPTLLLFTGLVPLGVLGGLALLFVKWWIGLIVIFFSLFPLRRGISDSVRQEVLRVAETNTSFFSCAIATGGLRFLVKEEDLAGLQYMDGKLDVPFFMPKLD